MDIPFDMEAEQAALGSLLIDPALMAEAESLLQPGDFHSEAHAAIYEAMLGLWRSGSALDYTLLCRALEDSGKLEFAGGSGYLAGLLNAVPTSAHFVHYAGQVLALANRRRVISAATEMQNLAREGGEVPEILEQAQALLAPIAARADVQRAAVPYGEALAGYWRNLALELSGQVVRVPFGFRDLDSLVGGLKPGDLCYIGGRPSMGKTTLCLQAALNLAKLGAGPTAVFSVESTEEELAGRILSYATNVPSDAMRKGQVGAAAMEWVGVVAAKLDVAVFLREDYDLSPGGVDAALTGMAPRPRLVVVDHVHRMEGGRRFRDRREEVTYISRRLKALAQKHEVPVVAVCTLSRAVENRRPPRPLLADLKETGDLEHDADVVLLLYWEGHYEPDGPRQFVTEAIVAKHRDGPTGTAYLRRSGQGSLSDLVWKGGKI
jgi:replicative DNA helicase